MQKRLANRNWAAKALCTFFLATIAQLENAAAQTAFTHPGIAHSQASIDFVKAKIASGEEPWASAWRSVQASRYVDLDWRPQPHVHVERGAYNNPDIGSSEFSADANASYRHALQWALTGNYLNGKGNGAVRNYFKPSGQCQESGRDQAHTQMGLDFLACTCEIAWNQDVDLYSAYDNRLLKGFEYTAKYNLGFDVPYEPYRSFEGRYYYKSISDNSRGRLRPMYEKVLNHYENRKGLKAEFTRQAVMKLREGSGGRGSRGRRSRRSRSAALGTLMFSEQINTNQS